MRNCQPPSRIAPRRLRSDRPGRKHSAFAFTLVEILVVLALLSLIVFALMAVFSGTQKAFRESLTQTDTLEGGRAVMDLMVADVANMTPSDGINNSVPTTLANGIPSVIVGNNPYCPVNFSVTVNNYIFPPSPLIQSLIGTSTGAERTNILENFFILSKANLNGVPSWIGTGYSVNTNLADGTLYPLYRYYMTTNAYSGAAGQYALYTNFIAFNYANSTNWSHLMDGVVDLTARVYDTNGIWMTNNYVNPLAFHIHNATFLANNLSYGETTCFFFSNAVPASVQIEMGTLEDRTLQHAEGMSGIAQSNYLSQAAAQVHIFRRRVWIRNLDPTAYQ